MLLQRGQRESVTALILTMLPAASLPCVDTPIPEQPNLQLQHAGKWRIDRKVEDVLSEERWARFKELQAEVFWIGRQAGGQRRASLTEGRYLRLSMR